MLWSALLWVLTLLWVQSAPAVHAHAVPVVSNPAANRVVETSPTAVSIEFNEPVVPALSEIRVLTQAGAPVTTGPLRTVDTDNLTLAVDLPEPLPDGPYLVSWRVLSTVDGHTTSGTFSFGVGETALTAVDVDATVTAQLSVLSAIARWLMLTGTALLFGLFAFRLFIWNPVVAEVELSPAEEALDLLQARRSIQIATGGLILIAVSLVLIFIDQAAAYRLWQLDNFQTWIGTRFGAVWLMRLLLLALSHFNLSLFIDVRNGRHDLRGWEWGVGLLLAAALALTSSLVSHSAALSEQTTQAVLIDWVHVLSAGLWAGGLVYLALSAWLARTLPTLDRAWLNLSVIINFSAAAAISVGFLAATGIYLAWQHVAGWTALIGTAYGLTLLVKLGIAAIMIGLAAFNLLVIKPRLNNAYESDTPAPAKQTLLRFRRVVSAEAVGALLLLLAAGVLTDLQRGVDAPLLADQPGETNVSATVEDVQIDLSIEPALVGPNTFDVTLLNADGAPLMEATDVSARFTFLGQSLGADEAQAAPLGNGRYRLEGSYISLIGDWQVEISVRRPGEYDTFAPFRMRAGVGGNIRPLDEGVRPLERFARFMTLAGSGGTGVALVIVAVIWGIVATRAARTEWQLIPILAISLLAFWVGSRQLITFFDQEYTPAKFATNPVLPDVESIAVGQQLYSENCVPCHGPEGHGDGPTARTLNPPPADFSDGHTSTHPDGDLYYWILEGIEGTQMPAFSEQISREEAWHLVNYVRRLSARTN